MRPVIQASAVRKTYGSIVAVDEVSFEVNEGEIFGLIGPNGAGKTTTMECIEGLRTPDRGAISVLGLDPFKDAYKLQERIGVQLAGKRYYPVGIPVPLLGFTMALLISTCSILSIGFLIASIVPTARFAQPIGAVITYPMIAVSGLFVPVSSLPPGLHAVARVVPLTYIVSLLEGIWKGDAWSSHLGDLAALAAVFLLCTVLSAKVFRWE